MTIKNEILGGISLGSDPEVLLTKTDGTPWGAITTGVTGTKEEPQKVPRGAIQVDGMALEFNIDPAEDLDSWVKNTQSVLNSHIAHKAKAADLVISKKSILDYYKYMESESPSESETLFGCDPDFCADTMKENTMPDNDGSITVRTAGGHVHIGMENWGSLCMEDEKIAHSMAQRIIYIMDLVLGCWSVLEDDGVERKIMYGKAGAYRIKPYGVEYRTLSNFWIFNVSYLTQVYERVSTALSSMHNFNTLCEFATNNRADIVKAINTNDKELATKLLKGVGV